MCKSVRSPFVTTWSSDSQSEHVGISTMLPVRLVKCLIRDQNRLQTHTRQMLRQSSGNGSFGYTFITNLIHWLLFIHKYYSPLHVSSIKCSSSGGHSCIQAAYGTVTLYKSSWWPVGTQLEWVLTLAAYRQATGTLIESDGTICYLYTTMTSWRWALDARNL